jgi:branched-chain amino acid transport system permease protein
MIVQQILNGFVVGSVYALFALGFTLIFGVHHILNMAHGAIFMWGAFVGLFAVTRFDLPFPVAFVLATVIAGLLSVVLDWVAFRPLRKRGAPEFSAIISSIGAGLILMSIAQRVSETRVLRYPFDALPAQVYVFFGLRVTLIQVIIVASALVIVSALLFYLFYTSFGRQIRAVAVSERTATLLGVNPDFVYFQTFFISGALAGAAGVLIGVAFNSVHFLMGEPYMLRAFVVIVLGGLGSVMGALTAGILLGLVQTLTIAYLSSALSDAIIFSILFATLLIRPTGFFGSLRKETRVARA